MKTMLKTNTVQVLKEKILSGKDINKEEALSLCNAPLEELCRAADDLRKQFCGNSFDLCTIVNGKCGRCSEDCKYCAQSVFYPTHVESYPLLDTKALLKEAKQNAENGVLRYSIVTSGKRLSDAEVEQVSESIREIREKVGIRVCVSFGLLGLEQFKKLKAAGASRVHCNLETSRSNFPSVCSTHTYDQKIETLKAAQAAGLGVCSGGIMGLGETMEDRIDMVLDLRELGVRSIPVNFLNPIPHTPYEKNPPIDEEERRRIIAIFRFLIPSASIRLAGGRGLMADKGESLFAGGSNAAISGDMLTTAGITTETDLKLLKRLGYHVEVQNE